MVGDDSAAATKASSPRTALRRLPEHVRLDIHTTTGGEALVADGAGATYSVTVGQVIQHVAQSNVPILGVQWILLGGNPIGNYTISQSQGRVTPLTPAELQRNPLTLVWTMASSAAVGVYIYTPFGVGYVQHNYVVTAPQVNFFESNTGSVFVDERDGVQYLRLGNPQYPERPGIGMNAVLFGAQTVPGIVGVLQLARNCRVATEQGGAAWHWSLNGRDVLDVGPNAAYMFYQGVQAPLPVGANAQLMIDDAPSAELGQLFSFFSIGDGDPVVPESYAAYLMFAPEGGIYVPLSILRWSWQGYSEKLPSGQWGPAQDPASSVNPRGVASSQFPEWSDTTANGEWVSGLTPGLERR